MIWYTLPIEEQISWEGHLSGFIVGTMLSLIFKKNLYIKEQFVWETEGFKEDDDPFLKQFDENGYFFEIEVEEDEFESTDTNETSTQTSYGTTYKYIYKSKDNL